MQHTKKMVLVSPETLSVVQDRIQDKPISSMKKNLTKLDQELKQILERNDLLPYDKVQLYNQTLQRYLTYYNQSVKKPISIKVSGDRPLNGQDRDLDPIDIAQNEEDPLEGAAGGVDDKEQLLLNFPVSLVSKAKTLLELVKNSGGILDYNNQGELVVEGKAIPGSHISDVLYDILLGKKGFEPRGWEQFLQGLIKMNVPERIVGNTNRRYKMIKMKQQGTTLPGMSDSYQFTSPPPKKSKQSKRSRGVRKVRGPIPESVIKRVKGRLNWDTFPSS